MARLLSDTLADTALPAEALAEMERLNDEAAPMHIRLRTRANLIEKPLCTPSLDLADEVVRLDQCLAAYRACVK